MASCYTADPYVQWANGQDWSAEGSERGYLPTEAPWEYASQGAFDRKQSVYAEFHRGGETGALQGVSLSAVRQTFGPSRLA